MIELELMVVPSTLHAMHAHVLAPRIVQLATDADGEARHDGERSNDRTRTAAVREEQTA